MTDISELIEKLEKSAGPSRELDALIATTARPEKYVADEYDLEKGYVVHYYAGKPLKKDLAPSFTRSLDAAAALVPDGWIFGIATHPPNEVFNPGGAQAYVREVSGAGYAHTDARTPALALCIAALRARKDGGNNG